MLTKIQPAEDRSTQPLRTAVVLRLTRETASQEWSVWVRPADGSKARLFSDLEAALVYIAGMYTVPR